MSTLPSVCCFIHVPPFFVETVVTPGIKPLVARTSSPFVAVSALCSVFAFLSGNRHKRRHPSRDRDLRRSFVLPLRRWRGAVAGNAYPRLVELRASPSGRARRRHRAA
eukprot:COSAG06_NODE_40738_length_399_cov_0.693333_1_plen_107_part_10